MFGIPWLSLLVCHHPNQTWLCLSVNYENVGPPLLCRPRFTDPVRPASGSLSFSASRLSQ